jgi:hypothetical protein
MHFIVQIVMSVAPNSADPSGAWKACKSNHLSCSASQMKVLQGSISLAYVEVGSHQVMIRMLWSVTAIIHIPVQILGIRW